MQSKQKKKKETHEHKFPLSKLTPNDGINFEIGIPLFRLRWNHSDEEIPTVLRFSNRSQQRGGNRSRSRLNSLRLIYFSVLNFSAAQPGERKRFSNSPISTRVNSKLNSIRLLAQTFPTRVCVSSSRSEWQTFALFVRLYWIVNFPAKHTYLRCSSAHTHAHTYFWILIRRLPYNRKKVESDVDFLPCGMLAYEFQFARKVTNS